MIDLHAHILPGLDDGADVMEEALAMAELAIEGGTSCIVATPHSNQVGRFENYCSKELIHIFESFEAKVRHYHMPLKIYRGMEIFASENVPELLKKGKLMGINGSRYCLIEFPFDDSPERMGSILESVLDIGMIPLIAHPERYGCIIQEPAILYEWMDMGCRAQINKGSLLGRFGRSIAKTASVLMEYELVSCIASDSHTSEVRTPFMADVREYVEDTYGPILAKRLLHDNPKLILEDKKVPFTGQVPVRHRRLFWR